MSESESSEQSSTLFFWAHFNKMPNLSVNTDLAQEAREAGYLKRWTLGEYYDEIARLRHTDQNACADATV